MALPSSRLIPLCPAFAWAQAQSPGNNIVTNGRTQTSVQVQGTTTNITTSTIQGGNAYNSFSNFTEGAGNTVNLQVPNSSRNLINIVRDSAAVTIRPRTLNAYKNGQIGGHVYFADPYGMVGSASPGRPMSARSASPPRPRISSMA